MTLHCIRLAKFIAQSGYASRRQAEQSIVQGHVRVNGTVISTPVTWINAYEDEVRFHHHIIHIQNKILLWRMHKPKEMLVTRIDPQNRRTIFDVIRHNAHMTTPHVIPVGRLDFNSEGLLLLTSCGHFAKKLMHPQNNVQRVYRVRVRGHVSPETVQKLANGIKVNHHIFRPIIGEIQHIAAHHTWLQLTLFEGKNREIRRIMQHFGHEVTRLIRIQFGPWLLDHLKPEQIDPISLKQTDMTEYFQNIKK